MMLGPTSSASDPNARGLWPAHTHLVRGGSVMLVPTQAANTFLRVGSRGDPGPAETPGRQRT